ncbi:hypothetical protein D8674_021923 [Pyrus ussuriensis x Pyrus communis]|uniref:Uncharacterized protein n=1 Tax=Pyrus ussuriensis x Pyrus communis TaxID=2448454 RepID=A0A5N5GII0_9ROSA|nr:hypothetical protein D8674_021923 [Pyrus ussuriensis x Pyrus communis]
MEGSSSSSNTTPNFFLSTYDPTELLRLQIELEEKETRIQELKKQIESTKLRLQKKKSVPNVRERMEALKSLIEIYKSLREDTMPCWLGDSGALTTEQ